MRPFRLTGYMVREAAKSSTRQWHIQHTIPTEALKQHLIPWWGYCLYLFCTTNNGSLHPWLSAKSKTNWQTAESSQILSEESTNDQVSHMGVPGVAGDDWPCICWGAGVHSYKMLKLQNYTASIPCLRLRRRTSWAAVGTAPPWRWHASSAPADSRGCGASVTGTQTDKRHENTSVASNIDQKTPHLHLHIRNGLHVLLSDADT